MKAQGRGVRALLGVPFLAGILLATAGCAGIPADRGGGAGQAPRITLTLANGNGDHQELQPFADAVARLSDDSVHIDFRDGVHAGDPEAPTEIIGDVKGGKFDLGWTGAADWHELGVTSLDALAAPFLIDSYELEEKVLDSPVAADMLAGLGDVGVVGVGIMPGPLKLLSGANHPFVRPADFVGATIAIGPSAITVGALRALGAKALIIGTEGSLVGADGVEAQLGALLGNKYDTVMKHTSVNVALFPRPIVVYANPSRFASLSESQQQALRLAAQQSSASAVGNLHQAESAAFATLCEHGSEMAVATAADLAALRTAVQPVYDELDQDAATASKIRAIETMKAQVPVGAPARSCPASSATPQPSTAREGFPDGTYEATISAAEMKAAWVRLVIPPEFQEQCPCTNTFTLKDGVMTGGEQDQWYSSFFGDHVSIGVQGSPNGAFTVRWSYDGHAVTFSDMVGGDAGDRGVFETKPFVKVK